MDNPRHTVKLEKLYEWLWAFFLLALPFTSLPLAARVTGGAQVSAPSALIALLLAGFWLLPKMFQGLAIPRHVLPLLAFLFVALVATLLAYFYPTPVFKGLPLWRENLSSILTLIMGICVYLVTLLWLREKGSQAAFDHALRLVTIGGVLILGKSLLDFSMWQVFGRYPDWYRAVHNLFSTGTLFRARVTGFAYEPSWLADQLNLLFIPYWFSAALTRRSAFKRKLWVLQVEDLCLLFGTGALFLTLSRLGYLSFLLMVGILLLHATRWMVGRLQAWAIRRNPRLENAISLLRAGVFILIGLIYIGILTLAVFALSKFDFRNEEIFNIDLSKFNILKYAQDLSFGARVSYWIAGWKVFSRYPFLGVGLGNAGFYFPGALPQYAWRLNEIRQYIFHTAGLLNIKSLWFRILAETGILGFAVFAAFLVVICLLVISLRRQEDGLSRTLGWMGTFTISTFLIEQLSLDTFALPYYWVSFALIAAGYEFAGNIKKSSGKK